MRAPYPHVLDNEEFCWCIPIKVEPKPIMEDYDFLDLNEEEFEEALIKMEILESVSESLEIKFIHVDNNLHRLKHCHPADSYFLEYRF